MSYQPTEWNTGDVITADKLNNIEQGIVNAGGAQTLIVRVSNMPDKNNTSTTPVLDKTFDELYSVVSGGGTILLSADTQEGAGNIISSCKCNCGISIIGGGAKVQFLALIIEDSLILGSSIVSITRMLISGNKLFGESADVEWTGSYQEIELTSNS